MKNFIGALAFLLMSVVILVGLKFAIPQFQKWQTYKTSDAANMKVITVGLDDWIGSFVVRSPLFKKAMAADGYVVKIDNDPNYKNRLAKLATGAMNLSLATVDSYLINGSETDTVIVSIVDESYGGDALISSKFSSLDELKASQDKYTVAYTPASPSEYLVRSTGVNFGIDVLAQAKYKSYVTNGSDEAYDALIRGDVDIAALWQPYVTKALKDSRYKKLIGTKDMRSWIVDILVANRSYANANPASVKVFLDNYFIVLDHYTQNRDQLVGDIQKANSQISPNDVEIMLDSVRWFDLDENIEWLEVNNLSSNSLLSTIDTTRDILVETQMIHANRFSNTFTLINSTFVKMLGHTPIAKASTAISFPKLEIKDWKRRKELGTLRLVPITFLSSSSELDGNGKAQCDAIYKKLKNFPDYRILVKGFTGVRGDNKANLQLSQTRADSVVRYLVDTYNIEPNRIQGIGYGDGGWGRPKQKDNESSREYNNRLKRVEIALVEK